MNSVRIWVASSLVLLTKPQQRPTFTLKSLNKLSTTITDELVFRYHLLFALLSWHCVDPALVRALRLCDNKDWGHISVLIALIPLSWKLAECGKATAALLMSPSLHISGVWTVLLQKGFLMLPINRDAFLSFSTLLSAQLSNRIRVAMWTVSLVLSS